MPRTHSANASAKHTVNVISNYVDTYPTCCPLVRFSQGASKMLRATGHARMVMLTRKIILV